MTAAATLADARAVWADAADIPDDDLTSLLAASWESRCEPFLPAEIVAAVTYSPADVPGYVQANILDARELWGAAHREGDVIGFDTYAIRARPLSDTVRSLLRPRRGRPSVG